MKIGLVCPYNLFKGGGVQECVIALQAELASRGHEVLIIAPQPKVVPDSVPAYVRLLGRSRDLKSPFHTTAQISVSVDTRAVDELLAKEQFELLHFHEPWVPLLSRQILTRSTSKNIATFHAKLPETMMSRTIERVITPYTKSILKYLDSFTAVSTAAADYVSELTDRRIAIVPNGIDLKKYSPLATASAPKNTSRNVLYVGRLEKRKGVMYLLRAMRQLQASLPDVELRIVGDGPDNEQLQAYAKELGVDATFYGWVTEADKLRLMSEATVFCSPARYGESFGIVLLEAMAAGVPTVAGNNPGYVAVMQETGALSIVNPQDTSDFARRLEVFVSDVGLQKHWKQWAKQYVDQYAYTKVVDQYEQIYKSVF